MVNKITKNTTLEKVLKIKGAEEVLAKFKFPCLTCPMMQYEVGSLTLGQVCDNYGIDLVGVLKGLEEL